MSTTEGDRARFTDLDETPAEAVINAVASLTGDDPLEMEPLSSVIDPDALNALLDGDDHAGKPPEVQFDFHGCRVLVRADGSVIVRRTTA